MQIVERVAEHYEEREVEYGRAYKWHPELVTIECSCGKRLALKRADLLSGPVGTCEECGKEIPAGIREEVVIQLLDEDYEAHHPWRCWHTTEDSGIPF
jgi:hypothetical protein